MSASRKREYEGAGSPAKFQMMNSYTSSFNGAQIQNQRIAAYGSTQLPTYGSKTGMDRRNNSNKYSGGGAASAVGH